VLTTDQCEKPPVNELRDRRTKILTGLVGGFRIEFLEQFLNVRNTALPVTHLPDQGSGAAQQDNGSLVTAQHLFLINCL